MLAVERCLIDLEVARVDDDTGRRVKGQRQAVRNAVCDAQEFDVEGPDFDAVARNRSPASMPCSSSFGSSSASVNGLP